MNGKDLVTVPYTFHLNDISAYPFEGCTLIAYEQALKDQFDQLYEEGANRPHDAGGIPRPNPRTRPPHPGAGSVLHLRAFQAHCSTAQPASSY